jgi:hypothetical protein
MASAVLPTEQCPRCSLTGSVERKLLLLSKGTLSRANSQFRPDHSSDGGFTVKGLKPEFLALISDAQFIQGLYCRGCNVGFLPESVAKPEAPAYKLFSGGWRRVFSDGKLGPLLERISDDPDSSVL